MTTKVKKGKPNQKYNASFGADSPYDLKTVNEPQYGSYFLTKEELEDCRNGKPINRPWGGGVA